MLCIVHISSATKEFSKAELVALLKQSREKNARLAITGILLYEHGSVMQLLEGPQEAVKSLIETIYLDRRHHGIIRMLKKKVSRREFPDWSMDFQNVSAENIRQVTAFVNEGATEQLTQADHLSPMRTLLSSFGFSVNV